MEFFYTRIEAIHRLQTGPRLFLLPLLLFRLTVQMQSSETSDSLVEVSDSSKIDCVTQCA